MVPRGFRRVLGLGVLATASWTRAHDQDAAGEARSAPRIPVVLATVETEPMPSEDDAADDAVVWPFMPGSQEHAGAIVGTDKRGGLAVYDLQGRERQYSFDVRPNNVDFRLARLIGDDAPTRPVFAASDRRGGGFEMFAVPPSHNKGWPLLAGVEVPEPSEQLDEPYGLCMYRSASTGKIHVFVNDKSGRVQQWRLDLLGDLTGLSTITGYSPRLVRTFNVGGQVEGMAADDELGWLYVGEERTGLWRYHAEPWTLPEDHPFSTEESDHERAPVDLVEPHGRLTADVEGVDIAIEGPDGAGYLLVSSQEADRFDAYERRPPNRYVGSFRVGGGDGIDDVSHTDGLAVYVGDLGPGFPHGVLVVQDDENTLGSGTDGERANQNFKLVPWERVRAVLESASAHRAAAQGGHAP
ncbi:MAG: phytase [Planctomycetota bacterium]